MQYLVLLLVCVAAVSCLPKWNQLDGYTFERYMRDFSRVYEDQAESSLRRSLFEERLAEVRAHNVAGHSWKKGINHLTDRTKAELRAMNGYRKDIGYMRRGDGAVATHNVGAKPIEMAALPASVDWRGKGVVSAVKDQGGCGSCWTFASAETIESHYALATGLLADISEQQILDCTPNPSECGGTGGCAGGTAELAFSNLVELGGGITSEWVYPYLSYRGQNFYCRFDQTNTPIKANVSGYIKLPSNQYQPLLNAVANVGPIAISVDASLWSQYESGVFSGCDNVTNPDIDHAVQLVGYGTDSKYGDYWLVRNSWSPTWGEQGYIRIARSSNPACAVDITPGDGTGCRGGPSRVTVCGECGMLYDSSYPIIDA